MKNTHATKYNTPWKALRKHELTLDRFIGLTGASFSNRHVTQSLWPLVAAQSSGVSLYVFLASIAEPNDKSSSTTSRWPWPAARWIAKFPSSSNSDTRLGAIFKSRRQILQEKEEPKRHWIQGVGTPGLVQMYIYMNYISSRISSVSINNLKSIELFCMLLTVKYV